MSMVINSFVTASHVSWITWNPADKGASVTLSDGDLTASMSAFSGGGVRATKTRNTGIYQYEIRIDSFGTNPPVVGVGDIASAQAYPGSGGTDNSWGYYGGDGHKYMQGVSTAYGATWGVGDYIQVVIDFGGDTLKFYKNGVSQGTAFTGIRYFTLYPMVGGFDNNGAVIHANFGATAFQYPIGGATAWDSPMVASTVTWNPSDKGPSLTLYGSNLAATNSSGHNAPTGMVRATSFNTTGKFYCEFTFNNNPGGQNTYYVGIANSIANVSSIDLTGGDNNPGNVYAYTSGIARSGAQGLIGTGDWTSDAYVMLAVDLDNHKSWVGHNGVWDNSGDPATGTNPVNTLLSGSYAVLGSTFNATTFLTGVFDPNEFKGTIPVGFTAWF